MLGVLLHNRPFAVCSLKVHSVSAGALRVLGGPNPAPIFCGEQIAVGQAGVAPMLSTTPWHPGCKMLAAGQGLCLLRAPGRRLESTLCYCALRYQMLPPAQLASERRHARNELYFNP
jgi:hypothetical protein